MVSLILLLGVMFVVNLQPVFMLSSLILITIFYSMYIYIYMGVFWYSYILLMVMLSGVLVVFTYMVVSSPNENFEIYNLVMVMGVFFMIIYNVNVFFDDDMSMVSMNLWMTYVGVFNLFIISFLLGIMLMVLALSYIKDGAFRVE